MPDITTEDDIKTLVDGFYARALADPLLKQVFVDFAHIDLSHHLPQLYDFWSGILLGTSRYFPLPLTIDHFGRWLELFHEAVDAHFEGPVADTAKRHSLHVGRVFAGRLGLLE
jgi:hemoglobin